MLSLEVLGTPAPKGSFRAMLVRGRPMVIPGGSPENQKALRAWDKAVKLRAKEALGEIVGPLFKDKAVRVQLLFRICRPASHYGARGLLPSAPVHHTVKPDTDKLARSVLDSLTGLLFDDDARLPSVQSDKQWCHQGREGVVITLEELPNTLQTGLEF